MYEHCFRNLGPDTRAKLRESRVPLVGFSSEVKYPLGIIDLSVTMGELDRNVEGSKRHNDLLQKEGSHILESEHIAPEAGSEGKDEPLEAPKENRLPEKVTVNDNYPDQPITIGGSRMSNEADKGPAQTRRCFRMGPYGHDWDAPLCRRTLVENLSTYRSKSLEKEKPSSG
ncbi:hypothetical protein Tco_1030126 [Tanacetum coccineum]|uniref:Uncharacterized protein n=1 Tax=Tanacetum coccineum TaxID=301880 RepID=A0ABQ5G5R5_9ASTR